MSSFYMIHVLYLKSHIYGMVVCFRVIQEGVYLGQRMRTDVTIWRKAKLFGVGPNSYTIVGHSLYVLVVNSIFRNLESGMLFSLIRLGNNPGLLHFPPN